MIQNDIINSMRELPNRVDHSSEESTKTFDRETAIKGLAEQLVTHSLQVNSDDTVLVLFETATGEVAQQVFAAIEASGGKYLPKIQDDAIQAEMLNAVQNGMFKVSEKGPKQFTFKDKSISLPPDEAAEIQAQRDYIVSGPIYDYAQFLERSTKVLILTTRKNSDLDILSEIKDEYATAFQTINEHRLNNMLWCICRPPTPEEAAAIDMPFDEYEQMYFEACNRPWDEVEKVQVHLVERLARAKKLRVVVPAPSGMDTERWSTDVTMEIEGQIPANSVARRNMPGSEVYLSPNVNTDPETGERIGTLTGRYAVPYKVMIENRLLPNLILTFDKGQVVNFETDGTEEEKQHLRDILNLEGATWIGEIGIGTNPVMKKPVTNTLLNEKILGVHFALGRSFSYKSYLGTPINIDNGVRSKVHIDIARVMTAEYGGGQIIVDDEVIFDNGKFLDPNLALLNS